MLRTQTGRAVGLLCWGAAAAGMGGLCPQEDHQTCSSKALLVIFRCKEEIINECCWYYWTASFSHLHQHAPPPQQWCSEGNRSFCLFQSFFSSLSDQIKSVLCVSFGRNIIFCRFSFFFHHFNPFFTHWLTWWRVCWTRPLLLVLRSPKFCCCESSPSAFRDIMTAELLCPNLARMLAESWQLIKARQMKAEAFVSRKLLMLRSPTQPHTQVRRHASGRRHLFHLTRSRHACSCWTEPVLPEHTESSSVGTGVHDPEVPKEPNPSRKFWIWVDKTWTHKWLFIVLTSTYCIFVVCLSVFSGK